MVGRTFLCLAAAALVFALLTPVGAEERERNQYDMGEDSDTALGFGIEGEHFDGLPVDAATIQPSSKGPAAKLDAEEAIDAKNDNPDPALGPAGPSPLGMPDASSRAGQ
jgi:hypothetical protein